MNEIPRSDWTLTVTQEDDGNKYWQFRKDVPTGVREADFPTGVTLEWTYADEGPPDKQTLEKLNAFGGHLSALNDDPDNSWLVHVTKGSGFCEWCYYVKDYERFMQGTNAALKGKARCPIEINFDNDPEWSYWRGVKECIE
jgi:hypothetical protein